MQVLALEMRLDISGVGRGAGVGWYFGTACPATSFLGFLETLSCEVKSFILNDILLRLRFTSMLFPF